MPDADEAALDIIEKSVERDYGTYKTLRWQNSLPTEAVFDKTVVPKDIIVLFQAMKGVDVIEHLINDGERREPLCPLPKIYTQTYMDQNRSMRILWARLQVEIPGYAERFQLYMMKQGLPMTHKEYVGVKQARSGGRPVTKYKLVMWLGMVVREWEPTKIHFDTVGFHGTPLFMAMMLIASGDTLRQVDAAGKINRTRSADHVKVDQAYVANFDTARCYTMPQLFQGALSLSSMALVVAKSTKKQQGCKHDRIVIATDALPIAWLTIQA